MVSYRRGEKRNSFLVSLCRSQFLFHITQMCYLSPGRVTDILEKRNLFSLLVFPRLLSYDPDENIESIILLYFQM